MPARSGRLRRIRARVSEHKKAVLGVTLLMIIVSASSLLVTQWLMFYINALGFETIAMVSLVVIAMLVIAVESRMRARQFASRVRSRVSGLRRHKKSSRRRR